MGADGGIAVTRHRATALALVVGALYVGTLADREQLARRRPGDTVLAGDFHVHAFPIDGTLPRWEIQREAARRGLDVVGITTHNQTIAGRLAEGLDGGDVITLPGQEITTPHFHIVAVGITTTIDWRLPVEEAIAEIHRQGGVAIAAHPVRDSWRVAGEQGLRALDGFEAAHGITSFVPTGQTELDEFYRRAKAVNQDIALIGSSDSHFFSDMGLYRTYVIVKERSAQGVMDAIRSGRTVAADANGNLIGDPALVEEVWRFFAANPHPANLLGLTQRLAINALLLGLAGLVVFK